MWQADPFKAKWTILAKAYSAIRDIQGKVNSPLDQFLAMSTPLVGIIEPHQYLEALGWNFIAETDGHIVIQREDPKFDADALSTSVSVNGVIRNCYMQGYFTGRLSDVLLTNDEATLTGAQPSVRAHGKELVEEDANSKANPIGVSAPEYQSIADQGNSTQELEPVDTNLPAPTAIADAPLEAPSVTASDAPQPVVSNAPTEALFPADFRLSQGEFALDEAFDPLLYKEQSIFDLFAGNQFDAFDWMDGWDEYINFDACA